MRQRDWSRSLWFCHQRLCRRTPVLTFSLLLKKFNSSYIFVVNSYWVDIILNLIYSCPATLIELSFHRWQRSLHQPLLWKTFQNHLYFSSLFLQHLFFIHARCLVFIRYVFFPGLSSISRYKPLTCCFFAIVNFIVFVEHGCDCYKYSMLDVASVSLKCLYYFLVFCWYPSPGKIWFHVFFGKFILFFICIISNLT